MRTHVEPTRPAPRALAPALEALRSDGVIVYPTDTGYAFGCAMSSSRGITNLRRLKDHDERSRRPLTMLVNEIADLGRYGYLGNRAFRLVRRLLPGPYTMVLGASLAVPRAMRNRDHEVGLRMPNHAVCRMLVELLGEPLLTASVTKSGTEPGWEEPELLERRFGRDVASLIDAGPLWPEPSTVLRFREEEIEVLRLGQGELPAELG